MKVVGAEGLDAQTIRDEVARGARFVFYQYCVSIVLMTLKRPSNVYLLKPGQKGTFKGLPYTCVSLLLGWWGFPWGPVYTLETVVNNLLGGKDVTDAILASLAPPAPGAAAAPAPVAPSPGLPQPPAPSQGRKVAVGAAVVAALAMAIVCGVCGYRSTHLTLVLVSGAPEAYTVELNGKRIALNPAQPVILTRTEGRFTLTGAPHQSAPAVFQFSLPFFDHLSETRVAVINPDRAAIIYEEQTAYYPTGTTPKADERPTYTLYVNEASYFLPAPDYVFVAFPHQIQMSERTARTARTRLALLTDGTVEQRASFLEVKRNHAAMRRYLESLADVRTGDEEVLAAATAKLTPEEGWAFFARHFEDRPVGVEWHRYYQEFMARHFPDRDLAGQYRAWLAADPDNGTWCYLLSRICDDPAEARALNQRALTGPKPCLYAYNSLGVDAMSQADFTKALEYFDAAAQKGLTSASLRYNRRAARLATGGYHQLLADAIADRKAAPTSLAAAGAEITCTQLAGQARDAVEKIKAECLQAIERTEHPDAKGRESAAAYLAAVIAYGDGDCAAFAREIVKLEGPATAFQAAASLGDHAAAAAALAKATDSDSSNYLICYLAAALRRDPTAGDAYFAKALEAMNHEGRKAIRLAGLLRRATSPAIAEVEPLVLSPNEQRVVMAALGWRYPERRAEFFARARRMNFDPAFPRLLIDQATAERPPAGA